MVRRSEGITPAGTAGIFPGSSPLMLSSVKPSGAFPMRTAMALAWWSMSDFLVESSASRDFILFFTSRTS